MKKTLFLLIASLFFFANQLYSQTIIGGTWDRGGDKVTLFEVENGKLKEIATSTLNSEKEFSFAFMQKDPGFYVVGMSALNPMNNHTFYLNPNDRLMGIAVDDKFSYRLIGEATPQNKEMERWRNLILPLETKSIYFMEQQSTYVDYFPLLESKQEEINNFKPEYSDDEVFNKAFEKYRRYDLLFDVTTFLHTPRSAHPQGEDFTDFFNTINLSEVTTDLSILNYPYGVRLINSVRQFKLRDIMEQTLAEERSKLHNPILSIQRDMPQLINPIVRGELILDATSSFQTFAGLSEFNDKLGKYLATENQKERMHQLLVSKADVAEGQDAFDFKFRNANDKQIALSDFKGKLVYIDIWATWCGPCIGQIPSLKELQKEYKDENIVFMGVSIDAEKDHEKWKQFLEKEGLTGVQLFAGDNADDISKPYKVKGIPRFVLIGKDGKVISSDAPRPSSAEIKAFLNASLKK